MPLAVSNIAWPNSLEAAAADLLQSLGVSGIEIAPTLVWPDPFSVSDAEILRYRDYWQNRGIRIVALQSLLFGRPDLQLFQDACMRERMYQHLAGMIRLAGRLRADVLVFGSPKNRLVGEGCHEVAWQLAVEFFRRLGKVAAQHGVWFCFEPNPSEYGCDFVTYAADGLGLVEEVDQPGFGLHLDAAAMTLSHDPVESIFQHAAGWWRHFHVSEPCLAPIGTAPIGTAPNGTAPNGTAPNGTAPNGTAPNGTAPNGTAATDHPCIAKALTKCGYSHWISIEMRATGEESLDNLRQATEFVTRQYPRFAATTPSESDQVWSRSA